MMLGFGSINTSVHSGIEELVSNNELNDIVILVDHEFTEPTNLLKVVRQCPSCVWDFEYSKGMINSEDYASNIVKAIKDLIESDEFNDPNNPDIKIAVFKVRTESVIYHKKSRTLYYCDLAIVRLAPAPASQNSDTDSESDDDLGPDIPEEAILKEELGLDSRGSGSCTLL